MFYRSLIPIVTVAACIPFLSTGCGPDSDRATSMIGETATKTAALTPTPTTTPTPQRERADLRATTNPKTTITPEELWSSQQIGDTFPYKDWLLSVLWWRESEIVIATKSDVRIDEGNRVWHAFPAEAGRKFVLVAYTVRLANDATKPMIYGPGGHWVQGKLIATNGREWHPKPMSRSYALGPDSYNNSSYSDWRLATEAEKHALPYRTINKELFPGEGIEEVETIWFEVVESDVPSKLKLNVKGTPIEIFDDEVPMIHLTPETALPPVLWHSATPEPSSTAEN